MASDPVVPFPAPDPNPGAHPETDHPDTTQRRPPRSEAQIEASRRNGAKSHGPTSPEGKAASSRNNLKHGAYAAFVPAMLSTEDHSKYLGYLEELIQCFGCIDMVECELARRMAIFRFQFDRYCSIEASLIDSATSEFDEKYGNRQRRAAGFRHLHDNTASIKTILAQQQRTHNAYLRTQRELLHLQEKRLKRGEPNQRPNFRPERGILYQELPDRIETPDPPEPPPTPPEAPETPQQPPTQKSGFEPKPPAPPAPPAPVPGPDPAPKPPRKAQKASPKQQKGSKNRPR